MKSIVVYYSRTGNTKKTGDLIAKFLGSEVKEVFDLKDRSGVTGYISGGKDAALKKLTNIKETSVVGKKFDVYVIGTPVWALTMAPAVRTFIEENKKKMKNVVFYCTSDGTGPDNALSEMEVLLGKKAVALLSINSSELKSDSCEAKIKAFCTKLKKKRL